MCKNSKCFTTLDLVKKGSVNGYLQMYCQTSTGQISSLKLPLIFLIIPQEEPPSLLVAGQRQRKSENFSKLCKLIIMESKSLAFIEKPIACKSTSVGNILLPVLVHSNPIQHWSRRGWHLAHLPFRVLSATVSHQNSHWYPYKSKLLTYRITNELLKVSVHQTLVVAVHEKSWWTGFYLHQVSHLQHFALFRWHLLHLRKCMDPLVQQSCWHSRIPLLVHS